MPFYEYECQNCKFYTELMQKISDPPLEKCPSCGKKTMQKLISAPVFRLKGSGWYETDFKGEGENKRNLAGADKEEAKSDDSASSSGKSTDAKADAKSDAKPAAAAETKSAPAEAQTSKTGGGRATVAAAKGGHKKTISKPKPVARPASRAPVKSKSKAKSKGKAGKGRR